MSSVYWQPRTKLIWAITSKIALTSQVSKSQTPTLLPPSPPLFPQEDCRVTLRLVYLLSARLLQNRIQVSKHVLSNCKVHKLACHFYAIRLHGNIKIAQFDHAYTNTDSTSLVMTRAVLNYTIGILRISTVHTPALFVTLFRFQNYNACTIFQASTNISLSLQTKALQDLVPICFSMLLLF